MTMDILPTVLRLAQIDRSGLQLDGIDLSELLLHGQPLPSRTLFFRSDADFAVRRGAWKLLGTGDQVSLYHLGDDLAERHDLAPAQPQLVKKLRRAWLDWEQGIEAGC